jgi:signal transduction histidine kinase
LLLVSADTVLANHLREHRLAVVRNVESRAAAEGLGEGRRERIGALVDGLIEALRHSGNGDSRPERPESLSEATAQCHERELVRIEVRASWSGRSIECKMRGDLSGDFDTARIEQATSNLIENALHHGNPQKAVQVSIDGTEPEMIVLKVKNEGAPISPDVMPVLFEPFSRGDSPRGLGLGLFVVKQVAVAHHGTVDVESSAEAGTTFTLSLPRAA